MNYSNFKKISTKKAQELLKKDKWDELDDHENRSTHYYNWTTGERLVREYSYPTCWKFSKRK